jgi:hypothetical protein
MKKIMGKIVMLRPSMAGVRKAFLDFVAPEHDPRLEPLPVVGYVTHTRRTKKGIKTWRTPLKRLHFVDRSRYTPERLREIRTDGKHR